MLRPADLLPPKRLLTPRLGHRDLSRCLGSATRRSGAYRGGTCTRWSRTTRWLRLRVTIVTTRHSAILASGRNTVLCVHVRNQVLQHVLFERRRRRRTCRRAGAAPASPRRRRVVAAVERHHD